MRGEGGGADILHAFPEAVSTEEGLEAWWTPDGVAFASRMPIGAGGRRGSG
jgi:hypothetical protein